MTTDLLILLPELVAAMKAEAVVLAQGAVPGVEVCDIFGWLFDLVFRQVLLMLFCRFPEEYAGTKPNPLVGSGYAILERIACPPVASRRYGSCTGIVFLSFFSDTLHLSYAPVIVIF